MEHTIELFSSKIPTRFEAYLDELVESMVYSGEINLPDEHLQDVDLAGTEGKRRSSRRDLSVEMDDVPGMGNSRGATRRTIAEKKTNANAPGNSKKVKTKQTKNATRVTKNQDLPEVASHSEAVRRIKKQGRIQG